MELRATEVATARKGNGGNDGSRQGRSEFSYQPSFSYPSYPHSSNTVNHITNVTRLIETHSSEFRSEFRLDFRFTGWETQLPFGSVTVIELLPTTVAKFPEKPLTWQTFVSTKKWRSDLYGVVKAFAAETTSQSAGPVGDEISGQLALIMRVTFAM
jgi:hypothetical protein